MVNDAFVRIQLKNDFNIGSWSYSTCYARVRSLKTNHREEFIENSNESTRKLIVTTMRTIQMLTMEWTQKSIKYAFDTNIVHRMMNLIRGFACYACDK